MRTQVEIDAAHLEAGRELHPLGAIDEAAAFFEAAAAIPNSTPNRAERVLTRMRKALSSTFAATALGIGSLLSKIDRSPNMTSFMKVLPPGNGLVLITARETCVVCPGLIKPPARRVNASPTIYTEAGVLKGELHWKLCDTCSAKHYYSYAEGGLHLPLGKVQFYSDFSQLPYVHVTEHTVWQESLLKRYRHQALHSHTGVDTFFTEYEALHGSMHSHSSRLRFPHAWLTWELLTWLEEMGEPVRPMALTSIAGLDAMLLELTPRMLELFVRHWGVNHKDLCPQGASCICYMLDGHMKCRRVVYDCCVDRIVV